MDPEEEADPKPPASPAKVEGVSFTQVPDHELLRQIGIGSYGEVWLARNALGSYRAVKIVFRKRFAHDRPFEREFSGIQKFEPISRSQEGLVHVLQVGRNNDAGYFYYVMELADDAEAERSDGVVERWSDGNHRQTQHSITPGLQRSNPPALQHPDCYVPRTLGYDLKQRGRLPFDECLRIGLALTSALAHLHKNGLVHRDIKPSNIIFVNGASKLADIGLVTDAADAPSYVGTEGFIPPEGPGTLQADIYSLGKVLYEIATGKDRHDYPELPTTLDETVNQTELIELNEIILSACRADPRQRYQSAEEMHADLVLLQRGRSIKQVHKLERRLALATRIGIATAAAALLAVGGYVGSVKQIQRARRAEAQAAANAAKAQGEAVKSRQVAQYLKDVIQDLGPSVALVHEPAMVRGILDRASERIDRDLANQPETAIELRETLAAIYGELGLFDKMAELARKNMEIARATFGEENLAVANALSQLGEAQFFREKQEEAETFTREALRIRRKLLGIDHLDVARLLRWLGNILRIRAKSGDAEAAYREGLAICSRFSGEKSLVEADLLQDLAVELRHPGQMEEAEEVSRRAVEIKRMLLGNEHQSVGEALGVLALVLKEEGKLPEAETLSREALAINLKLFGKDHFRVGMALGGLGATLAKQGRLDEAESLLRQSVAIQKEALGNDNTSLMWNLSALERVLRKQGKLLDAKAALRDVIKLFRNHAAAGDRRAQNEIAWLLATYPDPEVRDGRSAVTYAEKAVAATSRADAGYLDTLAAAYAEAGDFAKAVTIQKEAMALLRTEKETQDYASRLQLYQSTTPYRASE